MADPVVVETQTIPLGEAPFADYVAGRAKGNTTTVDVPKETPAEAPKSEEKAAPSGAQAESRSETDKEQPKSKEDKSQADEPWTPAMQAVVDKRINRELARIRKEYAKSYERGGDEPEKAAEPARQAENKPDLEPALSQSPTADEIRAHAAWNQREIARQQAYMHHKFQAEQEILRDFPDWNETVGKVNANVLGAAQSLIRDLPKATNRAILHHLATDSAQLEKFNAMSEHEQAEEVIRMSASLLSSGSRKPAQRTKPESQAPEPISPVAANTKSSPTPLGEMEYKDYVKARQAGRSR